MRNLALVALLGFAACGGITTKLCGAAGQPCCAQRVCDPGALCHPTDVCVSCGGDGQPCCSDNTCAAELSCVAGACAPALTCDVSCTLGVSRCAGNGLETCNAVGVCPAWVATLTTCPSGSVCTPSGTTADCVERCPNACTPDALLCTNEGLKLCVAGATCPTLMAELDSETSPRCITGAAVDSNLSWESPTPVGQGIVDIAGDFAFSYWLLDDLGNVLRYALGPWEYELRARPGKRLRHLASCGLGSVLYGAGEGGMVVQRSNGEWTEESSGTTAEFLDVACDSANAFALSTDDRLYQRNGMTWVGTPLGVPGHYTSLASLFFTSQVFLAGEGGRVARCDLNPVRCVVESTGTTANLKGIWADSNAGEVWAVGEQGTVLRRTGTWASVGSPQVTDTLVSVTGFYSMADGATRVVAVTAQGALEVLSRTAIREVGAVPDSALRAVWVPDENTILVASGTGALWYRDGLASLSPFVARGGKKPISAQLNSVTSLGQGRLIAVGAGGTRVRRQNGVWSSDPAGVSTTVDLRAVVARSEAEVYAVGDQGTVQVRRWGTWSADAAGLTTERLRAAVLDDRHLWVLGESALLQKDFVTGAWKTIALPQGGGSLVAMAAHLTAQGTADELIFAGAQCALWSYSPSTETFIPGPACENPYNYSSVTFHGADVFVGTTVGAILRRASGRLLIENTPPNLIVAFLGFVSDGSTLWAVGARGALYRRVSTGWSDAAAEVTTLDLMGAVKDDDGLFVVGQRGTVLRRP